MNHLIEDFEKAFLKESHLDFKIGDTIKVHLRIVVVEEESEENGNGKKKKASNKKEAKERIQIFTGTVISKKGSGLSETFTLYRNAYGSSMERVFLLHSPIVAGIKKMRSGKVRRSKLYYLRGASGKAAKVQEKMGISVSKSFVEQREEETQKEASPGIAAE